MPPVRVLSVAVGLAVASFVGLGAVSSSHEIGSANRIIVQPVKFTQLPRGWKTFDSRFATLSRHRPTSTYADALSWAYKPNPYGWASQMPRGGVAVSVILARGSGNEPFLNLCRYTPHLSGFPKIRRLPLRLPRITGDRLEGAPNVVEYRVFGRMDESYNVDLRVDVNALHPSRTLRRRAPFVVNHIHFPPWPRVKRC
jgi:hypothetical protein